MQEERCLLVAVQDAQESDLPAGEALDPAKTKKRKRISINPGTFVRLEELPASPGVRSLGTALLY